MCKQSSHTAIGQHHVTRVRFQEDHLEERFELEIISDQEKTARWMTRADFSAIHADVRRVVQEIIVARSSYDSDERDEKCFRGLEPIVSGNRKTEIQSFIQDLLEMQEECKYLGISGGKGLQCFSENNSKRALQRARQLADQDASEARSVYAESLVPLKQ